MRKTIAVVIVSILIASNYANAQTNGFKFGATFSTLSTVPSSTGASTLLNYSAGTFFWFGKGPLALQAEVLLDNKGTRVETSATSKAKIKLGYLEIPITALWRATKGPYAFAGPAVGFETSCTYDTKIGTTSTSTTCRDNPDVFARSKFDVSAVGGAGMRINIAGQRFLIEGRYTAGFNDIDKSTTRTAKNRSFAAFFSYIPEIRKRGP